MVLWCFENVEMEKRRSNSMDGEWLESRAIRYRIRQNKKNSRLLIGPARFFVNGNGSNNTIRTSSILIQGPQSLRCACCPNATLADNLLCRQLDALRSIEWPGLIVWRLWIRDRLVYHSFASIRHIVRLPAASHEPLLLNVDEARIVIGFKISTQKRGRC